MAERGGAATLSSAVGVVCTHSGGGNATEVAFPTCAAGPCKATEIALAKCTDAGRCTAAGIALSEAAAAGRGKAIAGAVAGRTPVGRGNATGVDFSLPGCGKATGGAEPDGTAGGRGNAGRGSAPGSGADAPGAGSESKSSEVFLRRAGTRGRAETAGGRGGAWISLEPGARRSGALAGRRPLIEVPRFFPSIAAELSSDLSERSNIFPQPAYGERVRHSVHNQMQPSSCRMKAIVVIMNSTPRQQLSGTR